MSRPYGSRIAGSATDTAARELTAAEIQWNQTPAPTTESAPILDRALDLIVEIENDDVADMVESLALFIIERDNSMPRREQSSLER